MSTITATAGAEFEATLDGALSLAGPLTVAIYDSPDELVAFYGPSSTGIVENPPGSGLYAVTLTAPDDAGTYSVVWSDGVLFARDVLEVTSIGGIDEPYFTIAEARAIPPLGDVTKYPDVAIIAARDLVESALEHACGVAFVPRQATDTINGGGGSEIVLTWPRVTAIEAVTIDGVAGVGADFLPSPSGVLYTANGFTRGWQNYSVTYVHGWPSVPPRVKQAALLLAKTWLVKGPIDDRATGFSTENGTFSMSTPGMRGAITGLPEVDATIQQYSLVTCVA